HRSRLRDVQPDLRRVLQRRNRTLPDHGGSESPADADRHRAQVHRAPRTQSLTHRAMQSLTAFNFRQWIDEHRHLLKPPVCNQQVFEENDFIVMVVGGPNSRTDYHYDEGPEFFYQLEGEMLLRTIQDGKRVDIPIRAGEILL